MTDNVPGHGCDDYRGVQGEDPGFSRLLRALCALVGFAGLMLVAPSEGAFATGAGRFAPGSVVVAQGGTIAGNGTGTTGVEANGEVDVYSPGSNGDVAPMASLTQGLSGPFVVVFDLSGDLWAANVNTSTLVGFTRAELGTPHPVPTMTISSATGALDNPYGMAFDRWGNL